MGLTDQFLKLIGLRHIRVTLPKPARVKLEHELKMQQMDAEYEIKNLQRQVSFARALELQAAQIPPTHTYHPGGVIEPASDYRWTKEPPSDYTRARAALEQLSRTQPVIQTGAIDSSSTTWATATPEETIQQILKYKKFMEQNR